jgi:hypothetical protein
MALPSAEIEPFPQAIRIFNTNSLVGYCNHRRLRDGKKLAIAIQVKRTDYIQVQEKDIMRLTRTLGIS